MLLPKRGLVEQIECVEVKTERRPHLGGSQIGHACSRYLFYHFRWGYEIDLSPRVKRIFEMGDYVEDVLINALHSIGMVVTDQQLKVKGTLGHAGGSIDGLVDGMLFEAKSANDKNYKNFVNKGVKETNKKYYAQLQVYMGKLELDSALFCVMNKNTCQIHIEEVPFNPKDFKKYIRRETEILTAIHPDEFEKIGGNVSWFECRYCDARQTCHQDLPPPKTCRSCKFAEIADKGLWLCGKHNKPLSKGQQEAACNDYYCDW